PSDAPAATERDSVSRPDLARRRLPAKRSLLGAPGVPRLPQPTLDVLTFAVLKPQPSVVQAAPEHTWPIAPPYLLELRLRQCWRMSIALAVGLFTTGECSCGGIHVLLGPLTRASPRPPSVRAGARPRPPVPGRSLLPGRCLLHHPRTGPPTAP